MHFGVGRAGWRARLGKSSYAAWYNSIVQYNNILSTIYEAGLGLQHGVDPTVHTVKGGDGRVRGGREDRWLSVVLCLARFCWGCRLPLREFGRGGGGDAVFYIFLGAISSLESSVTFARQTERGDGYGTQRIPVGFAAVTLASASRKVMVNKKQRRYTLVLVGRHTSPLKCLARAALRGGKTHLTRHTLPDNAPYISDRWTTICFPLEKIVFPRYKSLCDRWSTGSSVLP